MNLVFINQDKVLIQYLLANMPESIKIIFRKTAKPIRLYFKKSEHLSLVFVASVW